MQFEKYPKIYRLGKEDTDGILAGGCFISEKIDGANTTVFLGDNGELRCGSRNRDITGTNFNGFCEYVENHEGIKAILAANPDYRLFGEYLVKHTIQYKETAYKKFYLFDIKFGHEFIPTDEVYALAMEYGINTPKLFGYIENPSEESLKELVGESDIGEQGEGIVIKNPEFINEFGRNCYAKIVTEKFKEQNAIVFGGNNKHSESYYEMYVVNRYITLGRVQKIMQNIQPIVNERLDMQHIPRICDTVYKDVLEEEIWDIQKRVQELDFKKLKRLSFLKAKQIYIDILNDDISVADEK